LSGMNARTVGDSLSENMKTITIQIGNSDDKLPQSRWSLFYQSVQELLGTMCEQMHFSGASDPTARWQNAAWVIECDEESVAAIRKELALIATEFGQDSIAWTEGVTEFIAAAPVVMSGSVMVICGHSPSHLVYSGEGTHYCLACEAETPF
jgi:hypothetical protein